MGVLKNDKQTIKPIIESIRSSSHPWAIDGLASLIINVLLQLNYLLFTNIKKTPLNKF